MVWCEQKVLPGNVFTSLKEKETEKEREEERERKRDKHKFP